MAHGEQQEGTRSESVEHPVVVLATYDERANIELLLPDLLALDAALGIVVVDDSSPDGTADAVEKVAAKSPGRVHLIRRPGKLGYGSALVAGIERALELEADCVVTMDADFSHDPRAVPELVRALTGHDLSVGSRYVGGIRILNWSVWRLFLSMAANRYVSRILGLKLEDCTSGFRAYRSEVLRTIPYRRATSAGYAFLVELLDMAVRAGFRATEVPIVYEDRQRGQSKMDRWVILEAAWRPWVLLGRRLAGGRRRSRADSASG